MQWLLDSTSQVTVSGNDGYRREGQASRSFQASQKEGITWNWAR